MQELINAFVNYVVLHLQDYGILFGCFIIILESIIPALPLGVFVALNMMAFGNTVGFILSWISTIIGCLLSYCFFYKYVGEKLEKKVESKPKIKKVMKAIKKISFSNLVILIILPFTPAFLINIACGLTRVKLKKFLCAIMIGKVGIIFFWGYISKSLLESITDIKTLISMGIMLLLGYIISKIFSKKLNIE